MPRVGEVPWPIYRRLCKVYPGMIERRMETTIMGQIGFRVYSPP